MILLKSHNKGYTKKDGTVVKPFEDKRSNKPIQASFFDSYIKQSKQKKVVAPQLGIESKYKGESGGFSGMIGFFGSSKAPAKVYENAVDHPAKGDKGKTIKINEPHHPSPSDTWESPTAQAVFVPGGDAPAELNGIALSAWTDHPRNDDDWDYVDGQMDDLEEPPIHIPLGKKAASGCVIEEPDGRVWLVSPTNGFGGYETTYPKGKEEEGLSLQANAIKECFEESGLKVEITGLLGDFERTTSVTRLYRAKRVGGSPVAVGWESQAVRLVPRSMLDDVADHHYDKPINNLLKS